jgi:hypothetical protein
MVAEACNLSTWEAEHEFKVSLGYTGSTYIRKKEREREREREKGKGKGKGRFY